MPGNCQNSKLEAGSSAIQWTKTINGTLQAVQIGVFSRQDPDCGVSVFTKINLIKQWIVENSLDGQCSNKVVFV